MPDFAIDIAPTITEGFLANLRYFNTVMQLNIPVSDKTFPRETATKVYWLTGS